MLDLEHEMKLLTSAVFAVVSPTICATESCRAFFPPPQPARSATAIRLATNAVVIERLIPPVPMIPPVRRGR